MLAKSFLTWGSLLLLAATAVGQEPEPQDLAKQIIETAGGEDKLLKLFQFDERVLITATPAEPPMPGEKGNRSSVVEVGGEWWIGDQKRDKDKVRVLCWAWSLRILIDPRSRIQRCNNIDLHGKPAFGLRVTESVQEPIDLFFDAESKRLVAIDYTDTRHIFGEWKTTSEGHRYPSHVAGFRFTDREKGELESRQWYQTDILSLTPLNELPTKATR